MASSHIGGGDLPDLARLDGTRSAVYGELVSASGFFKRLPVRKFNNRISNGRIFSGDQDALYKLLEVTTWVGNC
jgi:hypothetical protein